MVNYLTFYCYSIANFKMRTSIKEMIPRIEIQNEFVGNEKEKEAFTAAINNPNYKNAQTFRTQVGIICTYLRSDEVLVSFDRIGKVFNEPGHCIMDQFHKFNRGYRPDGRPPKLSDEQIQAIAEYIKNLHLSENYQKFPTYYQIYEFVAQKFKKYIYTDTLRHIIREKLGHLFKSVVGIPMEENRMAVSLDDIEKNIEELKQKIEGVPTKFVFNLDEVGYEEFCDAHEMHVIVPIDYKLQTAPYAINRRKRTSVLACISCDSFEIIPQFTVTRTTIDSEIYKYLPASQINVVNTQKGYITSYSFQIWFSNIFLPYLRDLRQKNNYNGQSVLILDGYAPHFRAIQHFNLAAEKLTLHFLVPHSSHMMQPLDLCIFSVMKNIQCNYDWFSNVSQQTKEIIKLHNSLFGAAKPVNCRSSFRAAGIVAKTTVVDGKIHTHTHTDNAAKLRASRSLALFG